MIEAILLAAWAGSEHNWAQLTLILLLKAALGAFLLLFMVSAPFHTNPWQHPERLLAFLGCSTVGLLQI